MSDRDKQPSDSAPQSPKTRRRPYVKPRVVSEETFETLALSCAKANPFACPGGNPDRS